MITSNLAATDMNKSGANGPLHMLAAVERARSTIEKLCRQYGVRKFFLFGSALTERFDPEHSDLDFLVEFIDREPTNEYAERYLNFAEAIETLFDRPVDLISTHSIHNPYLQREIEATRKLIYEHSIAEVAF